MADQRLRSAERDVLTGEPGAPARLLRERLRAGTLDVERARLAAWLGDADAREALGGDVFDAFAAPLLARARGELKQWQMTTAMLYLASWVAGLEHWGREACVRAAVGAARATLP